MTATSPLNVSRLDAIEITNRHSRGEAANDIDEIMPTLSPWDVQFALVADGETGLIVNEAHDLETVRGWYEANRQGYDLLPGAFHTKLTTTEWYRFHEVLARIVHKGEVPEGVPHPSFPAPGEGGTGPSGSVYWMPVCVLFPVAPDGILGELTVWQFDMNDLFQGRTPLAPTVDGPAPYLNGIEYRNAKMLKEFAAAWQDGDVEAMLANFADDCSSVLRVVHADDESRRVREFARGKDQHRSLLDPASFGTVNRLTVVAIVQAPWYVFIEYDLDLETPDGRILRKMAAVYPIRRDGAILGQLAYAVDREPGENGQAPPRVVDVPQSGVPETAGR